jgi:hypothetical protein
LKYLQARVDLPCCVAELIKRLVLAPVGAELRDESQKQIERLLAPMPAVAFRGSGRLAGRHIRPLSKQFKRAFDKARVLG